MKGLDIKIKNWTYSQKEGRAAEPSCSIEL